MKQKSAQQRLQDDEAAVGEPSETKNDAVDGANEGLHARSHIAQSKRTKQPSRLVVPTGVTPEETLMGGTYSAIHPAGNYNKGPCPDRVHGPTSRSDDTAVMILTLLLLDEVEHVRVRNFTRSGALCPTRAYHSLRARLPSRTCWCGCLS